MATAVKPKPDTSKDQPTSAAKAQDAEEQSSTQVQTEQGQAEAQVSYSTSAGLTNLLGRLDCSAIVTSYQSGLVYLLGRNPNGGLHVHQVALPHAMGVGHHPSGALSIATNTGIIRFENVLKPNERANQIFDACFLPRITHLTGQLDAHDVGIDNEGRTIFVNTRYNCLATLSERLSFKPVWQPPFIDAIVPEDRCHINGMAMRDGEPAYVTAASRSNTVDGWRDRRADGGVVMEVKSGRVVCEGLSMPHSPRWHNGELWVLNSGTGELGVVAGIGKSTPGKFEPRVFCPGFVRGLGFVGNYAFVGLSKPRYQRFEGLELDERLKAADSTPWCGMQIIDLSKGHCAEWFRIDGAVQELYDVTTLPGFATPMMVAPGTPEAATLVNWETE